MKSISETGYSLKSSEPTNQPLVRNSTCNTLKKQYVINTNLFLFRLSTLRDKELPFQRWDTICQKQTIT